MLITHDGYIEIQMDGDADGRLDHDGIVRLSDELRQADASDVGSVLITGGDRFCCGRVPEQPGREQPLAAMLQAVLDLNAALRDCSAVTVTAVKGSALGLGLGLLLQSDVRVVADDAVLGFDEVERGIVPTLVLTWLDSRIPPNLAAEMIYLGRRLDGVEAAHFGLVSSAGLSSEVDQRAIDVVSAIVALDKPTVRATKRYWSELRRRTVSSDEFAVTYALAATSLVHAQAGTR